MTYMQTLKSKSVVDNRFEIVELVGSGGMGMVYRARQTDLDRTVALKFLLPYLLEDEHTRARFKIEAEALAALHHPNICMFYAYSVWHGRSPYIAMEYFDAPNLAEKLLESGGRFTWRRTLDIMRQICSAIAHAHHNGIIHRDLKPSNIFLLSDNDACRVKVSDFGLAKIVDDSEVKQKLTATGLTLGTAQYMSPEQARGEKVTAATDIYAAGCIMYECLFSRPPFDGCDFAEIFYKQLNHECRLPSADSSDIPEGLLQILQTALDKKPQSRFQSMDEMVAAIDDAIRQNESEKDSKSRFTGGAQSTPQSKPRRPLIKVALVGLVLIAIGAGAAFINAESIEMAPYNTALQKARRSGDAYDAAKIELQKVPLYEKWHRGDQVQESLTNLAEDAVAALSTDSFKRESLHAKEQFLSNATTALLKWKPPGASHLTKLNTLQIVATQLSRPEGNLVCVLRWKLQNEFEPRTAARLSLAPALTFLEFGPTFRHRQEEIDVFNRLTGNRTNLSDAQLVSQVTLVRDAAKRGASTDMAQATLPIFHTYCLHNHSPQARKALALAASTIFHSNDAPKDPYVWQILAACNKALAQYYSMVGDQPAIDFFHDAIANKLAKGTGNGEVFLTARWQRYLADALSDQGAFDQALPMYDQAIKRESSLGKTTDAMLCCKLGIGEIFCQQNKLKEAAAEFVGVERAQWMGTTNANYISREHVATGANSEAVTYCRIMGLETFMRRFHKECAPYLQPDVRFDIGQREDAYTKLVHLGQTYRLLGADDQALKAFDQAWKFADQPVLKAKISDARAIIYSQRNDEVNCLAACKAALADWKAWKPQELDINVVLSQLQLGRAYRQFGKLAEARETLEQAKVEARNTTPFQVPLVLLQRDIDYELIFMAIAGGDTAQALTRLQSRVEADTSMRESIGDNVMDFDRGMIAYLQKNYEEADWHMRSALYTTNDRHHHDYARLMTGLAKLRLAQGDRAEAGRLLKKALHGWKTHNEDVSSDYLAADYRQALNWEK